MRESPSGFKVARLFIPIPEMEFLDESVRLPESNWETRYFALPVWDESGGFCGTNRGPRQTRCDNQSLEHVVARL